MKLPKVRIGTLMLLVVILALIITLVVERRNAKSRANLEVEAREREQIGGPFAIGVISGGEDSTSPAFSFTADGRSLIVAGWNGGTSVRAWDVVSRRLMEPTFPGLPSEFAGRIAFSADGRLAAHRDRRAFNLIHIVDLQSGKFRASCQLPEKFPRWGLAFSPDSAVVAVGGASPAVELVDSTDGRRIGELALSEPVGPITHLAFSPDGKAIAVGGHFGDVILIDAAKGQELGRFGAKRSDPHADPSLIGLAFSPDSRLLSEVRDDAMIVWEAATGREVFRHAFQRNAFGGDRWVAAFAPSGSHLLLASTGGLIKLFEVPAGQIVRTMTLFSGGAPKGGAFDLCFSPDRRLLAGLVAEQKVIVWDLTKAYNP